MLSADIDTSCRLPGWVLSPTAAPSDWAPVLPPESLLAVRPVNLTWAFSAAPESGPRIGQGLWGSRVTEVTCQSRRWTPQTEPFRAPPSSNGHEQRRTCALRQLGAIRRWAGQGVQRGARVGREVWVGRNGEPEWIRGSRGEGRLQCLWRKSFRFCFHTQAGKYGVSSLGSRGDAVRPGYPAPIGSPAGTKGDRHRSHTARRRKCERKRRCGYLGMDSS